MYFRNCIQLCLESGPTGPAGPTGPTGPVTPLPAVYALYAYSLHRISTSGEEHNVKFAHTYAPFGGFSDWVCFCYGEIDCRCHVHKHVTDSYPYQAVIDELVCRYMAGTAETVATVPDIHVAVYMVPPPVQNDVVASNAAFPFLGSDEDRVAYTRYANAALETACALHNYAFVNAYDAYTTCDGFLEGSKSDGCRV